MPYFSTSQEWVEQSALLLQARPKTARITTKYSVQGSGSKTTKRRQPRRPEVTDAKSTDVGTATTGPTAHLVLKTYDPESGTCLKYKTDKAAEVGRLIASLGRLGKHMAALPVEEDTTMTDAPAGEQGSGTGTPLPEAGSGAKPLTDQTRTPQSGGSAAGGGGKKKKKGKK